MSAHHDELQDIENIKYFWKKGGKWLAGAAIVGALAYWGYTIYQNHQSQGDLEAAAQLMKVNIEQPETLDNLQTQYPQSTAATQASLQAGVDLFNAQRYDEAISAFQWVLANQKDPTLQLLAAQNLSNVYVQQNKLDDALNALDIQIEALYQDSLNTSKADIYVLQGKIEEARQTYQSILDKLPENAANREILQDKLARLN